MRSSYYTPADSRRVSVLMPGLLASEAVGSTAIQTPYLCRCLSHASLVVDPTHSLECAALKWFNGGRNVSENCAAIAGYMLDVGTAEPDTTVLRADPVYQQMDINHAVLADQSVLDLNLAEAKAIEKTMNQHFSSDGVEFTVADAYRWYVCFKQPMELSTSSPGQAAGRDVSQESPVGPQASLWRSWLAEIEMLLYSHPVNLQRQRNGKVPVNSVWLWGEGIPVHAPGSGSTDPAVFSDSFYPKCISRYYQTHCSELDDFPNYSIVSESSALLVDDQLQRAAVTADEALRADRLNTLEKTVFEPLWRNLGRSGWVAVRLWVGGDKWLHFESKARHRFWRRQRPLSHFVAADSSEIHDN